MRSENDIGGSAYEETTALVQELDALKQRGSNLLVVGSRMPAAHETACRQFLGDQTTQPRRRLFVLSDPSTTMARRTSLEEAGRDRHSVVRYNGTSRSTTAAVPDDASLSERHVEGDVGELGLAITEAIAEFETRGDGLAPAELRLCFDSLTPLVSEHEPEVIFRFLHLLTHRVRSVRGMAHYHLSTERSNRTVALLEPLFDAVIELRLHEGELHQRWYLRDSGLTTGWLHL